MNGITGNITNPELDAKARFAPKLKPEVKRVAGNPFYPNGYAGSTAPADGSDEPRVYVGLKPEVQRQVFEANLPISQQENTPKVGTMLNTVA